MKTRTNQDYRAGLLDQEDRLQIDRSSEIGLDGLNDILQASHAYWRSRCRGGSLPGWRDVSLMELPSVAIPFVTVVDVHREPLDFVYRYWGTGHVEAKGIDRTGQPASEHPQGRESIVTWEYRQVMEEARAIAFRRVIRLPEPRLPLYQISLRLPLAADGVTVDKILSVCDWLSLRHAWDDIRPSRRTT